ncbi:MAG: hypothetical protein QGH20_05140 [Candidatus Latescibacteria bacterium]|jgi:hypothetical protein|nr:hypothetical protein [Candidatus Latescibacterota bacterium]
MISRRYMWAIALIAAVVGCGATPPPPDIEGDWAAYHTNAPDNLWTFNSDGTCRNISFPPDTIQYAIDGVWNYDDGSLNVTFSDTLLSETLVFTDVFVSGDRLLYSNPSGIPVAYRRSSNEVEDTANQTIAPINLDSLAGTWVAYSPKPSLTIWDNMWTFYSDGTCENTWWVPLDDDGRLWDQYTLTGGFAINEADVTVSLKGDQEMMDVDLADVVVDKGRLLYTNEVGVPVVFKRTLRPTGSR